MNLLITSTSKFDFTLAIVLLIVIFTFSGCGDTNEEGIIWCDAEEIFNRGDAVYFKSQGEVFNHGETQSDEMAFAGKYSVKLNNDNQYGPTYSFDDVEIGDVFEVSVWKFSEKGHGFLVVSDSGGKNIYRKVKEGIKSDSSGWEFLCIVITTPITFSGQPIKFYTWNPNQEDTYFDNFRIRKLKKRDYGTDEKISIILQDSSINKLNNKRMEALEYALLETKGGDWVKGIIRSGSDSISVRMRLKGDWTDHLMTEKWSFRIKANGDKYWKRFKEFSIQNPMTRGFLHEWVLHKLMDGEDVLTTTYGFLPVEINGINLGLYAYEEHFTKGLLESRNRREGPIFKFDESGFFERFKNQKVTGEFPNRPFYQAATILPFKKKKITSDQKLYNRFLIGQNLMQDYKNCNTEISSIFDLESLAKFAALVDLCKGFHSLRWHNQRFYYNPVLCKLEPILYDAYTENGVFDDKPGIVSCLRKELPNDSIYSTLFRNKGFAKLYYHYLTKFSSEKYIDSVFTHITNELDELESMIRIDDPTYSYDSFFLKNNASKIRKALPSIKASIEADLCGGAGSSQGVATKDPLNCVDVTPLESISIRAYTQGKEENFATISVENFHCGALMLIGVGSKGRPYYKFPEPILIPGFSFSKVNEPVIVDVYGVKDELFFTDVEPDSLYSVKIFSWPRPVGGSPRQKLFAMDPILSNKYYTISGKQVIFRSGVLNVRSPVIIPENYEVFINKGTEINFLDQGFIISESPVNIIGTRDRPVVIRGKGSVSVLTNGQKSFLRYVNFDGLVALNYDKWTTTSAVTFYEADLDISDCKFLNNFSEDALNLIRCRLTADNLYFQNSSSDALDFDFCSGKIGNIQIVNCGNDGLDLSGSEVHVSKCIIKKSSDKGISVGEDSKVFIDSVYVFEANIGITSKDMSILKVGYFHPQSCNYPIAAFQKKPEYGYSLLEIDQCSQPINEKKILIDAGSSVKIGGREVEKGGQIDLADLYAQ